MFRLLRYLYLNWKQEREEMFATCPHCNGVGVIQIKAKIVKCTLCAGRKRVKK